MPTTFTALSFQSSRRLPRRSPAKITNASLVLTATPIGDIGTQAKDRASWAYPRKGSLRLGHPPAAVCKTTVASNARQLESKDNFSIRNPPI